jgi:hypothetical protein
MKLLSRHQHYEIGSLGFIFVCIYMQLYTQIFFSFHTYFLFMLASQRNRFQIPLGSSISKLISVHYQVCKTQAVKVSNQMSYGFGASEKPAHISKEKYDRPR